jgi:hypothetical protein
MDAFERQLAGVVRWRVGPVEPVDDAAIFRAITTANPSHRWWVRSIPTRLVAASAIVALVAGIVVATGAPWLRPDRRLPAAGVASPTAPSGSPTGATPVPGQAVVMGPSEGSRLGVYKELGRFSDDAFWGMREQIVGVTGPAAIDDQLVMVVHTSGGPAGYQDIFLRTTDALTWQMSPVPGRTPWVDDLAATNDGLLAVGHDGPTDAWQATLWASEDGHSWRSLEPPPDIGLVSIVSTEDPLAVRSFDWLWVQDADGEWVRSIRVTNMTVIAGPGGFLAWDDRNGEGARAFLMYSRDLMQWDDVDLSASPDLLTSIGTGHIAIYATDHEWVFVPSRSTSPNTVFTSRDGLVWQEAARPPEMDRPTWISTVGTEVQALEGDDPTSLRLWTWRPGEDAGPPEPVTPPPTGHGYHLPAPVSWQGDWVTVAFEVGASRRRPAGDDRGLGRALILLRSDGGADDR